MANRIDDATYKQTYYFTDDFSDTKKNHPSIEGKPTINTSIKENPYRSNVEIEGGEIVLQPDLSALFKANGKKHSGGGMDVLLRPQSFIFSDFKDLSISEQEKELFELKKGGSTSPYKNTPAEVLKKNVNIKHYNTLIDNITDVKKDDLARKSSAMMLEKYIETIGNIAYLQERKKGLPDGVPSFSLGTAPVYDADKKEDIDESKQYMKYGGKVNNPYMQWGGGVESMLDKVFNQKGENRRPRTGNPNNWVYNEEDGKWYKKPETIQSTPTKTSPSNPIPWGPWKGDRLSVFQDRFGVSNAADKFDLGNWDVVTQQLGYTGPKDNLAFQKWLYSSSPENKAIIDKWHNQYEDPSIAVGKDKRNRFDQKVGIRWESAINEILNGRQDRSPVSPYKVGDIQPPTKITSSGLPTNLIDTPTTPQGPKRADWKFTPWQKLSQLYNWGQYAGVQRYMPYRSHYNATYADPYLLNPEQTVADVKGIANQQTSSLGTLNPILRGAQASSIYGQALNQIPGIRTQYDNQNAQIMNQFRQYNNQVRNNESLVNMSNDQQYYQQAVEGRKNFSNLRQFAANNAMNNLMRDVETNQKLSYNLMTMNNPAYSYDWDTGDFVRNPMNIKDIQTQNVNDIYSGFMEELNSASTPEDLEKLKIKERILRQKNILPYLQQPNPLGKKGGKVKNPYK